MKVLLCLFSLLLLVGCMESGQPSPSGAITENPQITERFDVPTPNPVLSPEPVYSPEATSEPVIIAIGGDVNLIEGSYVMPTYRYLDNGLTDVLKGGLLEEMLGADVLLLNNEFAYTQRGYPLPGKGYVFRAPLENVEILKAMGVDVAFLANNHVYDYGPEGLEDTLAVLDGAGILHIGAGMDLTEARAPVYIEAGDFTIAFIGAGCIERYTIFTPGAGEETPGIFRADEKDADELKKIISEAENNSDFVAVNLHWGIESTTVLEDYQRELAQICVDAGADAVIGSHPHVLQGAEFINGVPVIYSTGNFWFSTIYNRTCLIELIVSGDGALAVKFLPCTTGGGVTELVGGDEAAKIFEYYESISFGVEIDAEGFLYPLDELQN